MNVERVEALTAAGRMRPPGLAEVAAAQADGRWAAAYAARRDVTVPPDLAEALAARPRAAARFDALGRTGRYRLILPLLKARTPAGREARLARALAELA
ncbi:YdeI/OmpD-associated family protein [Nonomuraea deserti]|uniref:YdeI/OmpD-associated family protein n=1 Tax=Nonomuraea deserti TaxID=1848322 RepID=UPI001FE317E1|nr:YdeI/OmpD-associated family protein [Nonomuraea deserti]